MKRVLACVMGVVLVAGLMPSIPLGGSAAWADSLIPATATPSIEQSEGETWIEDDCSDRILQAGGLNEKELVLGKAFDVLAASTSDEEGAAAAIVAACEAWDGERSTTTVDVSAYNVSMSRIGQVFYHVINEHPQLFYVDHTYRAMGSNGVAELVYVSFDTTYDASSIATFNAAVDQVLAGAEDGWSDEQKALYLHDYIVTHCEYDLTYQKRSAYTVLVDHSSVCQGYALAFDYLAEKLGMTDTVITSEALNHAWNLVDVNGETYYVDCTWDDPTSYKSETHCLHKNFLRNREGLSGTGHGSKKVKTDDGEETTTSVTDWADTWGENVYSSASAGISDAYESAYWSDVVTPIPYANGLWAYVHGAWQTKTVDVMVHDYATGKDRVLASGLPGTWSAWNKPGYIWNTYHYNYLVTNGKAFYVTAPTGVYCVSIDGGSEVVYTLSDDEVAKGYVYGISYDADEASVSYCLSEGYNVSKTGGGVIYLDNSLHNATVTLAKTSAAYNGKTQSGAVKSVVLGGRSLVAGTDYTVSAEPGTNVGSYAVTVKGIGNYAGTVSKTFEITKAASSINLAAQTKTYAAKALAYSGKVTKKGSGGKVTYAYYSDSKCTRGVKAANVKAAGTYYVKATLAADANYAAATSAPVKFTIGKAANPMKVSAKTATVSYNKKKAVTLAASKVFSFSKKAQGGVSYARVAKGSSKWLTVNSSGKVTVKAGAPRATHKLKVKVTAKGDANYESLTKTVTVKVRVK